MAGAELALDATPRSVPLARRWLRDMLGPHPVYDVEVACLLLSELTTNALLHARTGMVLRAFDDGTALRVEVQDGGCAPAVADDPGRGLAIVALLAAECGADPGPDGAGRTAWFVLDAAHQGGVRPAHDVSA